MKNKIVFTVIIVLSVIFCLSMLSCEKPVGRTLDVRNRTDEAISIVIITGTVSFNELSKRIDGYTEDEKRSYIHVINPDEDKSFTFDKSTIITYLWWTASNVRDFGSETVKDDSTVTITARKP